ncbi:MAG: RNA polymerase sigma factor RpoD/SigA [Lentisphaerales bacterium]|nr:RNA polymerase sigma factor RpoD/SigA [Lentisphaerales bacterium]
MNTEVDSMQSYMQSINKYPLVTQEEEIKLADKIKSGCEQSREKLILSNLRLVVKIAYDFKGMGQPILDLIAEGNIGLIRASEKFDPTKGAKFSSYAAWWIKQSMRRSLANQVRTVRIPAQSAQKLYKIRQATAELTTKLKREPTDAEIADHLDFSKRTVISLNKACKSTFSLQSKLKNGETKEAQDLIADQNSNTASDIIGAAESLASLKTHLNLLNDREKLVITLRFGLYSSKSKTLEEICIGINRTRERVRQIQNSAIKKLRIKMNEENLIS